MATRITVEWMTDVPRDFDGTHNFDAATWSCQMFSGDELELARKYAQKTADLNDFGQTWLYVEHADSAKAPDWQWERDYSADEIFEAA